MFIVSIQRLSNKFENQINEILNENWYDTDDQDLFNYLKLAKQQLAHIQQIRQELGI